MEANKHEASASSADQRLGTAPLTPLIFKLALPTALAQLVNMLYNIVDRIYVGHIPETGSLALAGLGVTYPIIVLITAFSNLIGMGGAPRASVAMGRGDYKTAEKILGNCITLLIALSVALSVVFTIFGEPVLRAFGASENTLPYAMAYLRIYLLGTIFVQFTLGMTPFITNQGFAMTSMATTCIGAVSNIILDPIFIYGFNMGVEGAAIATILSQAISAVWVLIFFTGKRNILRIRKQNLFPSAKTLALVLSLGVSPFLMTATECVIQLAFNTGAAAYGGGGPPAPQSILSSVGPSAPPPGPGGGPARATRAHEPPRRSTGKTVYILDEPTTGLHIADVHRLIEVLQKLVDAGNTVIVIEHNLDLIKCADYIIDLGPEGGSAGGKVIAAGTPEQVAKVAGSFTGQYLKPLLERDKQARLEEI